MDKQVCFEESRDSLFATFEDLKLLDFPEPSLNSLLSLTVVGVL